MKTVSKSQLKAHMLEYFRQVEATGQELIVTNHRKPVLKVSCVKQRRSVDDIFADVRARVRLPEEVVLAPETGEWGEHAL